jgi:transcriptional regulator with XRE-family HTH domain
MPKFESFEKWIEERWGSQTALAEKLGVAKNTVSLWAAGKSRLKGEMAKKIRALGYDGPFPETGGEIKREDLEALRLDLRAHQGWIREEVGKDSAALGAVLQEVLKRLERIEEKLPG